MCIRDRYKRVNNHWHKRWCVIKENRFLSYKNNARERPDEAVLLKYAALCTPSEEAVNNYYMFKLRFEGGETSVVFRARREDDLLRWVDCLKVYFYDVSQYDLFFICYEIGVLVERTLACVFHVFGQLA